MTTNNTEKHGPLDSGTSLRRKATSFPPDKGGLSDYTFDAETHTHYIGGYPVEGVTTVLRDLIPGYAAAEWHLQRGAAVHACAAMIGQCIEFENDPQIDGQVTALRKFHSEPSLEVEAVELPVWSTLYRYAGIADLIAKLNGKRLIIDFKASMSAADPYQLAAYALLTKPEIKVGVVVEIHADGTYRIGEQYDLKRYKNEWLSLLTAYRVRRKCKVKGIDA